MQVTKLLFEFPDYPAGYGGFVPGPEVQRYIEKYAKRLQPSLVTPPGSELIQHPDFFFNFELNTYKI